MNNEWILLAIAQGVYDSFEIGIPFTSIGGNPLDLFMAGGKKNRSGGSGRKGGITPGVRLAAANGRRAHRTYQNVLGPKYKYEQTIGPGNRVDAISYKLGEIRELKPDTISGKLAGARQLKRYLARMREIEPNIPWVGILDTYRP